MDSFCTAVEPVVHTVIFFLLHMENQIEIVESELRQLEGTVAKHL